MEIYLRKRADGDLHLAENELQYRWHTWVLQELRQEGAGLCVVGAPKELVRDRRMADSRNPRSPLRDVTALIASLVASLAVAGERMEHGEESGESEVER